MIIDEQKRKAIELLVAGEYTKTDIAEIVGVSRQCIYNWLDNGDFVKALDTRLQSITTLAEKEFDAKLEKAIDEYWKLAMTTQDSRTKEKALSYWIDRCLGKTTTKLDVSSEVKVDNRIDDSVIDSAIKEFELEENDGEMEEEYFN